MRLAQRSYALEMANVCFCNFLSLYGSKSNVLTTSHGYVCGRYMRRRLAALDLARLPSQTTSSRWQVDKETIGLSRVQQFSHLCVARPYQISVNSILNIFTLLTLTQSFGSLFHSCVTLCAKEYFLMSNLHCSLTNAALCPLVLLPSLSLKNIFLSTSS